MGLILHQEQVAVSLVHSVGQLHESMVPEHPGDLPAVSPVLLVHHQ